MLEKNSVTDQTNNNLKILFPDYILEQQTHFNFNDSIYEVCKTVESKYKNFAQNPNINEDEQIHFQTIGGYQARLSKPFLDLTVEDGLTKENELYLKKLQNEILLPSIHYYIKNAQFEFTNEELLTKSWFVKYNKNSFQELHTHGTTILTQIYFVKVPKDLKFIGSQPKRYEGSLVICNTKNDWDGLRNAYIKPEEGKLVIINANYPHYTLPVLSDEDRVTIVQDVFLKRI